MSNPAGVIEVTSAERDDCVERLYRHCSEWGVSSAEAADFSEQDWDDRLGKLRKPTYEVTKPMAARVIARLMADEIEERTKE